MTTSWSFLLREANCPAACMGFRKGQRHLGLCVWHRVDAVNCPVMATGIGFAVQEIPPDQLHRCWLGCPRGRSAVRRYLPRYLGTSNMASSFEEKQTGQVIGCKR
jgi:hypothetical protein